MFDLASRTASQALLAGLPWVFAGAWIRAFRPHEAPVLRWTRWLALPLSGLAGLWFQSSTLQARWEALFAALAVLAGLGFWRMSAHATASPIGSSGRLRLAATAGLLLVFVRQSMEIAAVLLIAVVQARSADALLAISAGVAAGAVVSLASWWSLSRLNPAVLHRAVRLFTVAFTGLALWYGLHESSEAGLLPYSDVIHVATEPYGPDGLYGRYFGLALLAIPLAGWMVSRIRAAIDDVGQAITRVTVRQPTRAFVAGEVVAGLGLLAVALGAGEQRGGDPVATLQRITARPHLVFRHTGQDANYGRVGVTPLDAPGTPRGITPLSCERIAWAGRRGLCLQADRGVFTSYRSVLVDSAFTTHQPHKLDGSPSRARLSADGRLGASTVFVTGHAYTSTSFSTRTVLLDAESGDELGDLEQFSTWRDTTRLQESDFNFWGVTFARDGQTFYASLGTGGKTYLVKGDLTRRRVSILRDNLECPSLSPDGRTIAFKKLVSTRRGDWRIYLLDLATMQERPLTAETRVVDDQIEWLDDTHVLYGLPRTASTEADIWIAATDGAAAPRVFLPQAESPAVVC